MVSKLVICCRITSAVAGVNTVLPMTGPGPRVLIVGELDKPELEELDELELELDELDDME